MGLGSSREWFGQRSSRQSYRYGQYNQQRNPSPRRRISTTIVEPIMSLGPQSPAYQTRYNNYYPAGFYPPYARMQPMASPYPPFGYNQYPVSLQAPPQYMMMMPPAPQLPPNAFSPYGVSLPIPSAAAAPPVGSPISPPYFQQAVAQPVYSNIGAAAPAPYYSPPYSSAAPSGLITDWTGGGKISPGFLGPPI